MKETEIKIKKYIADNMPAYIKYGNNVPENSKIRLPKPFTVPSVEILSNFFYWDTYFTNIALYEIGLTEQAKNNIDNMKYLIDTLGFVPNADHLTDRSQPPLYTRSVYDYYKFTGDKSCLAEYLKSAETEYKFWMSKRLTPCGLNRYWCHSGDDELIPFYDYVADRLDFDSNAYSDKIERAKGLMAIAESGWDFTPRFEKEGNAFAGGDFAHVDLNSFLYDAELKMAFMFGETGETQKKEFYTKAAEKRKALMDKYLKDDNGVYLDYDFTTGKHSGVISAASFTPYAAGVSADANSALRVLKALEQEGGIAACENKNRDVTLQWDYPNMWPCTVYFAVIGLKNAGRTEDGKRLAKKYIDNVEGVFEKTGQMWEKYNSLGSKVTAKAEYGTPPQLGWTAGVYLFCLKFTA